MLDLNIQRKPRQSYGHEVVWQLTALRGLRYAADARNCVASSCAKRNSSSSGAVEARNIHASPKREYDVWCAIAANTVYSYVLVFWR